MDSINTFELHYIYLIFDELGKKKRKKLTDYTNYAKNITTIMLNTLI